MPGTECLITLYLLAVLQQYKWSPSPCTCRITIATAHIVVLTVLTQELLSYTRGAVPGSRAASVASSCYGGSDVPDGW